MILHLVRHPPVSKVWQKRCYGQSDPGLSRDGQKMIAPMVSQLAALKPDAIIHSDLQRTLAIAEPLARSLGVTSTADPHWRERDFGAWEGHTWNAIYRATGNAMDGMVNDPDHYRPGGGETTQALATRVQVAMQNLPDVDCVVVVSHGGPIACAISMQMGASIYRIASLIPSTGSVTVLRF
ncbi:histidine phosphatase family protein [Sphingorhabdus sp.]|uniref:histidine phosphatase family protein n=1 Tax=Sphingorhabdus sp. TaxID=1902408 RepID=UPI003983BF42